MARALELKLQKAGYQTDIAANGREALDLLGHNRYDLLLLDIIMPKVNGFAVLEQLKKQGKGKPQIIVTTNLEQDDDRKRALELGAIDYLVKSDTSIATIVEKINHALNQA